MLAKTLGKVDNQAQTQEYWGMSYVDFGKNMGFLMREYSVEELEKSITRYEAMEMIINCFPSTKETYVQDSSINDRFRDLENNDYKVKNIANILDYCEIFKGYPDSTMRIENNITRAEASTIIVNFIENKRKIENFKMSNLIEVYEDGVRRINLGQLPFNLQERKNGIKNETKVKTRINDIEIFRCEESYDGKYKNVINEMYNSQLPYFEYRKKFADVNFIIAIDFTTINGNLDYEATSGYGYLVLMFQDDIKILDKFDLEEIKTNKKGKGYNGMIVKPGEEHRTTAFFVIDKAPTEKIEINRSFTTMYDPINRVHLNINSADKLLINLEDICEE